MLQHLSGSNWIDCSLPGFQAPDMTSNCSHIKTSQPAPRLSPGRLPPDVAGYIIYNDSHPELVPGERALEAPLWRAGQWGGGGALWTPLKIGAQIAEQPHAPEPSLLIRGRPEKDMADAAALGWFATTNPQWDSLPITDRCDCWVCVCVRVHQASIRPLPPDLSVNEPLLPKQSHLRHYRSSIEFAA